MTTKERTILDTLRDPPGSVDLDRVRADVHARAGALGARGSHNLRRSAIGAAALLAITGAVTAAVHFDAASRIRQLFPTATWYRLDAGPGVEAPALIITGTGPVIFDASGDHVVIGIPLEARGSAVVTANGPDGQGLDIMLLDEPGGRGRAVISRSDPVSRADVDGSGEVDIQDLLRVIQAMGSIGQTVEDVGRDGVVDIHDVRAVLNLVGERVPADPAPADATDRGGVATQPIKAAITVTGAKR